MDDVEDSSLLRRGSPTAHTVYGIPHTINTSGYVYFLAYQELFKLRPLSNTTESFSTSTDDSNSTGPAQSSSNSPSVNPSAASRAKGKGKAKDSELDRLVTEEMLALHRGQGLEIFWRDSLTCPSEEEYIKMVRSWLLFSGSRFISRLRHIWLISDSTRSTQVLGKTGGLFRIAVKLMMAKSESDMCAFSLLFSFFVLLSLAQEAIS